MVEFGGSSYVNRVAGTVGSGSSPIAGATGGSSPWALFAAGATGAQGADGIMDVVFGVQGFTGVTGAATGNAGGMFYLQGATGATGTNGYFFNDSDDLTGRRWEFFNDHESSDLTITFGANTTVNGVDETTGATVSVGSGRHVTVMAVATGQYIVWFSSAATVTPLPA
jgi:hypothetical protein